MNPVLELPAAIAARLLPTGPMVSAPRAEIALVATYDVEGVQLTQDTPLVMCLRLHGQDGSPPQLIPLTAGMEEDEALTAFFLAVDRAAEGALGLAQAVAEGTRHASC